MLFFSHLLWFFSIPRLGSKISFPFLHQKVPVERCKNHANNEIFTIYLPYQLIYLILFINSCDRYVIPNWKSDGLDGLYDRSVAAGSVSLAWARAYPGATPSHCGGRQRKGIRAKKGQRNGGYTLEDEHGSYKSPSLKGKWSEPNLHAGHVQPFIFQGVGTPFNQMHNDCWRKPYIRIIFICSWYTDLL